MPALLIVGPELFRHGASRCPAKLKQRSIPYEKFAEGFRYYRYRPATCLLLATSAVLILHRASDLSNAQANTKTEIKSATSVLVARIDDQAAKLEKLSEAVRLSMPREIGYYHTEVRIFMIKSQLAQAEDPMVIAGDSIREGALLPSTVCGHSVVNAGIGGADEITYAAIINDIFPAKPVALIVVALGTNNSTIASPHHIFAKYYAALADRLMPHAQKLMFVGLPRIDMSGQLALQYFDRAAIDRHDAKIRAIAKQRSVDFIDIRSEASTNGMTVDGVHLTAAGYKPWGAAILSGVESELGCKTAQN